MTGEQAAVALMHKPLTDARILKTRRHLADDPWKRPGELNPQKVSAFLSTIEQLAGENSRRYVEETLRVSPPRAVPPLPDDIAAKVETFQRDMAARKAAKR